MYDRFIFTKSMTIHAYADRPERPSDQVEIKFLQTLIDKAIEQGSITQDDVQDAIESAVY